ncbi:uncharacterized protein Dvir_GJ23173, partial [Drosophila virilis]
HTGNATQPQSVSVSAFYNHEQAVAAALVLSSMSASARYDAYDAQLGLLNGSLAAAQVASSSTHTATANTITTTPTLPQVFLKPSPPSATAVDGITDMAANTAQAAQLPTKFV